MNSKKFNIFLIIFLLLGFVLFFLKILFYSPPLISLLEDNQGFVEKVVNVSGTLKNIEVKDKLVFFEVCELSRCLDVVYFNPSKKNKELLGNASVLRKKILLNGKLTIYENSLELILYKFEVE